MRKLPLHENWRLQAVGDVHEVPPAIPGRQVAARAPGCVHTDLLAAGLIQDPYLDRNEAAVQWIGKTDWRYFTRFTADASLLAADHVELVCEGLDTVATVELNGTAVGTAEDMHIPYRFDVRKALRAGENELAITFRSPIAYAREMRDRLTHRPHLAWMEPFNFIRKMACNFGWDWGPNLTTSGIWQPIYIHAWNSARIAQVVPMVTAATADRAEVTVRVAIEGEPKGMKLSATLTSPGGSATTASLDLSAADNSPQLKLTVANPQLWWPVGHGAQPLYKLEVHLDASPVSPAARTDQWQGNVGLRTVRLDTSADSIGTRFVIEVNGKPIYCKGANWIPDDCFLDRVTAADYKRGIDQAVGANMNMLRVWGGGIFERDEFYDQCDRAGIMVWQDFLFACALYPEEEPFRSLVEREARHAVAHLAPHPSLVIWNGSNENIWAYFDWTSGQGQPKWGNIVDKAGLTWGRGYYLDLLPKVVAEIDPSRPYWPSSPYSGTMDINPGDPNHGNNHVWGPWNQQDYDVYYKSAPRFVGEFGWQGAAMPATWSRAIPADSLVPDSPAMLAHQKGSQGHPLIMTRLAEHFPTPRSFADWVYLTQLNQARAVEAGVRHWRSAFPTNMGVMYWQLNDCWPVTSWAAVDGDGRCKPLWYATRRFYAGRLLSIDPQGEGLMLVAHNDADTPWDGEARIRRLSLEGRLLAEMRCSLSVGARWTSEALLPKRLAEPTSKTGEFLVADMGGVRSVWFFDIDRNLPYPEPDFTAAMERRAGKIALTIRAGGLMRDIALYPDLLDASATVDEQLVTLLAGESFTFNITTQADLTLDQLTSQPVMQCANFFGAAGQGPAPTRGAK